jgi:PPOX class probable F420-dependent enzyme
VGGPEAVELQSSCRFTPSFFVVRIDDQKFATNKADAMNSMKLDDTARQLIGSNPATLVTVNRDGSPQVSLVWVTVQRTADGDDELVTAHLQEHQKIRNIRRDPRVAVTIVSTDRSGPQTPYLSIRGRARVEEGGAPELLDEIATTIFGPGTGFPPPDAPAGYLTHITIEKVGGVGPWAA